MKRGTLSSRSRWAQLANWGARLNCAPRSSSETPRGGLDHSGLALVNSSTLRSPPPPAFASITRGEMAQSTKCGPFKTVGAGFSLVAAGLIAFGMVLGIVVFVRWNMWLNLRSRSQRHRSTNDWLPAGNSRRRCNASDGLALRLRHYGGDEGRRVVSACTRCRRRLSMW